MRLTSRFDLYASTVLPVRNVRIQMTKAMDTSHLSKGVTHYDSLSLG